MTFRKFLFWTHLTVGSIAGVVIFTMCVTGVLLAYQRQILHFAERSYRAAPASGAQPLPLETLLDKAHAAQPSAPASVIWRSSPDEPVEISFGRDQSLLLNPYTGAILGVGATHTRAFFHSAEEVHRWLAFGPEKRSTGRAITAACNLGFLLLVGSGPFLWLPRRWSSASFKLFQRSAVPCPRFRCNRIIPKLTAAKTRRHNLPALCQAFRGRPRRSPHIVFRQRDTSSALPVRSQGVRRTRSLFHFRRQAHE